jgi:hypothetical protein
MSLALATGALAAAGIVLISLPALRADRYLRLLHRLNATTDRGVGVEAALELQEIRDRLKQAQGSYGPWTSISLRAGFLLSVTAALLQAVGAAARWS